MRPKTFDRNSWHPAPLSSKIFCDTSIYLKQRRLPLQILLRLWDEKFSKKNRDKPSYALYFSWTEISETLKETSTKSFATVTEDEFNRKTWEILSFAPNNFRCKKLPDLEKGPSTKTFGSVRPNNFVRSSWHPAPLSSLTIFETTKFLKHRRFLYKNCCYCETEHFWQKLVTTAPSLIKDILWYHNFSETTKVPPTNSFETVGRKIFDKKLWYTLLRIKFFVTRK